VSSHNNSSTIPKESIQIVTDEEPKTLDSLFKKTISQPPIYYLPLSEEEVLILIILGTRKEKKKMIDK
jgi:hypothetical protein